MADVVHEFAISIDQVQDYEFRIKFDKEHWPELDVDEPLPLGRDSAPNASRVLAAAIGNCLSASLLFCARKARVKLGPIRTQVKVRVVRDETRRLRIGGVDVLIDPGIPEAERAAAARCLDVFEDYCTVTQSVRRGIDVNVKVKGFDLPERPEAVPAS